ncbi:ctr copper transporter [Diaporthe amygdali]|uniref:ctr copper transporter n=1 Tax=Phomopsis amygdali TaxID=1214568 RepID=UPI0022FE08C0|nr:ctr copper transporter [Diaporthe amygdali]KAJ0122566.1 ctr copper transporter [Diaporthe amygdali]
MSVTSAATRTATRTITSGTTTATATAMATGSGSMGMSMSNVVGSAGEVCEIHMLQFSQSNDQLTFRLPSLQMLWNWHTIGACFITPQWQIGSQGAMVGTCFGVVFLVMALEALRRSTKQFDRYLIRKHRETADARYHQVSPVAPVDANHRTLPAPVTAPAECCTGSRKSSTTAVAPDWTGSGDAAASTREKPGLAAQSARGGAATGGMTVVTSGEHACSAPYRPNLWQQMIRALLHAAQFTVAYIIMMLAMNYNGYILISIIIGAYFGAFLFSWETLWEGPRSNTSAAEEPTVCCS